VFSNLECLILRQGNLRLLLAMRCIDYKQRCQMNFLKSARSDIKIGQNPPDVFWAIFSPSGVDFLWVFLVLIRPCIKSGPGEILFFLENVLQKNTFNLLVIFICWEKPKYARKSCFLPMETPKPPEFRQIQQTKKKS
jgi:hypothetical protein